ncbi:putative heterokaryon incompatibility protein [Botrytis fragariae]|uniref:Putative heterokaryon incompatibility protein n=1 Tax=Botrytis fragariae TaxID=1964551 RepID=A0A8H6EDU2_9HELO|nr:putative heterokaryon incompatibility protein [Botrytis fragariae]KAF5868260.1 putative heterokaryon incompatibility protein [Botrytis fragariae]
MTDSPTWSALLYRPLGADEIRVLCLEPSSRSDPDDSDMISCQMRPIKLTELGVSQEFVDNETASERVWRGLNPKPYDYTTLFKPRRGLFDRPLKAYIKSLKETQSRSNEAVAPTESLPHLSDRYVALSYVWGSLADKKTILVNGIEMQVTQNLRTALIELRKSNWVRRRVNLWIDALCINQDDLDEREQQVKLMRDIYAMAWQVVVSLGPSTSNTTMAYTILHWLAHEIGSNEKLREFAVKYGNLHHNTANAVESAPYTLPWHDFAYKSLRSFFACQYWHRLWILQELAMARMDAPVIWGDHSMCLRDIWKACQMIERQEDTVLQDITTHTNDADRRTTIATIDRRIEDREGTPGQQWKHLIRIQNMREWNHGGVSTALPALELARQAQATDARDKVYGILAIPCVKELTKVSPNYRIELPEIFTNFTREIISNNDHGLDILRLVHSPVDKIMLSSITANNPRWMRKIIGGRFMEVAAPCIHKLPSWVVCWSCSAAPVMFLPGIYKADRGFTHPSPPVFLRDNIISSHAVFVDSIATLSAFNAHENDGAFPKNHINASSIQNAYGTIDGLKEAFWKTIVADTTPNGEKPSPSWAVLRLPRLWTVFGTTEGGGSGLDFSLHSFAQRNEELAICGTHLKDLLADAKTIKERKVFRDEERSTSNDDLRDSSTWAANVLAWRRLFGTQNGRVGLTVASAMIGDSIVVLPGCSVPLVLRRDGTGWRLIGECFVYGLMNGETADLVGSGMTPIEEIKLH